MDTIDILKKRENELMAEVRAVRTAISALQGKKPKGIKSGRGKCTLADGTRAKEIHKVLSSYKEPLTMKEICSLLPKMPEGSVSSGLHDLKSAGYIVAEKNGSRSCKYSVN